MKKLNNDFWTKAQDLFESMAALGVAFFAFIFIFILCNPIAWIILLILGLVFK